MLTREEIEVKYILDCLFAKSKIQKSPDALNIMANSGDWRDLYTTQTYWRKLKTFGGLLSRDSSFDNFIWAFTD